MASTSPGLRRRRRSDRTPPRSASACRLISMITSPRLTHRVRRARPDRPSARPRPGPSPAPRCGRGTPRSSSRTVMPSGGRGSAARRRGAGVPSATGDGRRTRRRGAAVPPASPSATGAGRRGPRRGCATLPGCRAAISRISSSFDDNRLALDVDDDVVRPQPGALGRRVRR